MTDQAITRAASRPAAGAIRGGVAGIIAAAVGALVLSKTGSAEIAGAATAITVAALQYIGKVLRSIAADRGWDLPTPV